MSVYFMTGTPEGSIKSVFFCGAGNLNCDPWFTTFCCLWPCSLAVPELAGWANVLWWFNVQELRKAQPALILVLKRLRRRGNGLKSHQPGIPGLQGKTFFVAFLGINQFRRVGLRFVLVL